jgi:hypothetical protein
VDTENPGLVGCGRDNAPPVPGKAPYDDRLSFEIRVITLLDTGKESVQVGMEETGFRHRP